MQLSNFDDVFLTLVFSRRLTIAIGSFLNLFKDKFLNFSQGTLHPNNHAQELQWGWAPSWWNNNWSKLVITSLHCEHCCLALHVSKLCSQKRQTQKLRRQIDRLISCTYTRPVYLSSHGQGGIFVISVNAIMPVHMFWCFETGLIRPNNLVVEFSWISCKRTSASCNRWSTCRLSSDRCCIVAWVVMASVPVVSTAGGRKIVWPNSADAYLFCLWRLHSKALATKSAFQLVVTVQNFDVFLTEPVSSNLSIIR